VGSASASGYAVLPGMEMTPNSPVRKCTPRACNHEKVSPPSRCNRTEGLAARLRKGQCDDSMREIEFDELD